MQLVPLKKQSLTRAQFEQLADVPPEEEWLANITNVKTRRAYKNDVREFIALHGAARLEELRTVTRAHVIAWRKDLERRDLSRCRRHHPPQALGALLAVRLPLRAQRSRRQSRRRRQAAAVQR